MWVLAIKPRLLTRVAQRLAKPSSPSRNKAGQSCAGHPAVTAILALILILISTLLCAACSCATADCGGSASALSDR